MLKRNSVVENKIEVLRGELEMMRLTNDDLLAISRIMDEKIKPLKAELSEEMDEKLNRLETKLTAKMDEKIERLEIKLIAKMDEKIEPLEEKLTVLEKKVTTLDEKVTRLEKKVTTLDEKVTRINLTLENNVLPRLQNIEACYTSTYSRYASRVNQMDAWQMDMDIVKSVLSNHSEQLQHINETLHIK